MRLLCSRTTLPLCLLLSAVFVNRQNRREKRMSAAAPPGKSSNSKTRHAATASSAPPDAEAAQAPAAGDERACVECKSTHVDVYCLVCRDFFCAACDSAVHRGKLARHRRARVTPFYFTRPDARPPSYRCLRHADVTDDSLSYCATCHGLSSCSSPVGACECTCARLCVHGCVCVDVVQRCAARSVLQRASTRATQ